MSCGLELIRAASLHELIALEAELASCGAVPVGMYHNLGAFHAAARELLEHGLQVDDNYYRDPVTGCQIFSLWYYPRTG